MAGLFTSPGHQRAMPGSPRERELDSNQCGGQIEFEWEDHQKSKTAPDVKPRAAVRQLFRNALILGDPIAEQKLYDLRIGS